MDLQFKYNPETLKIETNDSKIFIGHAGSQPPRFRFKLFWDDREILFHCIPRVYSDRE